MGSNSEGAKPGRAAPAAGSGTARAVPQGGRQAQAKRVCAGSAATRPAQLPGSGRSSGVDAARSISCQACSWPAPPPERGARRELRGARLPATPGRGSKGAHSHGRHAHTWRPGGRQPVCSVQRCHQGTQRRAKAAQRWENLWQSLREGCERHAAQSGAKAPLAMTPVPSGEG